MFNLSNDEIIKLNIQNKRWFYQKLILEFKDKVSKARTLCLIGLGHWCYAKWIMEDFPHLKAKNITIMASANLNFLYKDLENVYNIMYVKDSEYYAGCMEAKMKYDFIVMNPPYQGSGEPKFMQIAKVFYENCRNPGGCLLSINPTSVSDNTYPTVFENRKKKYGGMKVESYTYSPEFRTAFDAAIGTGICITLYSDNGKYTIFDDYVREQRFGKKNWDMRKSIVEEKRPFMLGCGDIKKGETPSKSIAALFGIKKWTKDIKTANENSSDEAKRKWEKYLNDFNMYIQDFKGKNVVILAHIRGNVSNDGEHKWDWTTLQSDEYLRVQNELPNMSQVDIPFDNKEDAVNLIKWLNTDFLMFVVYHYKTQMTNNMILFKLLPQPPALDGNYSDEVLMKHFNLTQEEMDWIHSEMKDFGWKVNLGKTESELMVYIDEINK